MASARDRRQEARLVDHDDAVVDVQHLEVERHDGLVAAIAQDAETGRVLMMAWMDDTALARTIATRKGTYFSRSRGEYWVKGETSGHHQAVREVRLDCDGDTLLLKVDQTGAACHTGDATCFDADLLLSAEATA